MSKLAVAVVLLAACTEHQKSSTTGTQSLRVTLTAPTDVGAPDRRLANTINSLTLDLEALDDQGDRDTSFTSDLSVYAQFLGTLSPSFGDMPLATLHIDSGVLTGAVVKLPTDALMHAVVFGPTTLWIDNGTGIGPNYMPGTVTGVTPQLWYPDPVIANLQTPSDESALNALLDEPLENKQISVSTSRYGANGKLLVNAVFAQGYTVEDCDCTTTPCKSNFYDYVEIFSFSAPRAQNGQILEVGHEIAAFNGGLSEFQGLTEVGFPQTVAALDENNELVAAHPELLPQPVKFKTSWFTGQFDMANPDNGTINFERNEANIIEVDDVVVCDLDSDFVDHQQWKIDPTKVGGDCSNRNDVLNVVTSGISTIDPTTLPGKTLTKVVGSLRPLNFGGGNNSVWLIFPRSADEVTFQ